MSGRHEMERGPELAEVRKAFETWRKGRKQGRRIPEKLWSMAAEVARNYGNHRTAKELRLNWTALKERVEQSKEKPQPQFVQLGGKVISPPPRCTVEIENQAGARMLMHLEGMEVVELATLVHEFSGAPR